MRRPQPTDIAGLVEAVRREGSVHYAKQSVPAEFLEWRRQVRKAARAQQLRISITRTAEFVIVENRDYEVSDDDLRATTDVMAATLAGRTLSFDDALRARRRQRMSLVIAPTSNDRTVPGLAGAGSVDIATVIGRMSYLKMRAEVFEPHRLPLRAVSNFRGRS